MMIERRTEADILRRTETKADGAAFAQALRGQSASGCGDQRIRAATRRQGRPEAQDAPAAFTSSSAPERSPVANLVRTPAPGQPVKRVIIGPHRPPERLPGPVRRIGGDRPVQPAPVWGSGSTPTWGSPGDAWPAD